MIGFFMPIHKPIHQVATHFLAPRIDFITESIQCIHKQLSNLKQPINRVVVIPSIRIVIFPYIP